MKMKGVTTDSVQDKGTNNRAKVGKKKHYGAPSITRFGSLGQLTLGSGGNGNDAGGVMTKMSDRRAKCNLVSVGRLPAGMGLYLFNYLPDLAVTQGSGRQLGVMADEVQRIMPEAVHEQADGYQRVDYAKLNISAADVASALLH